ncbi:MAG: hypothetical protein ABH833_04080 [Parcubacteria group bacterium]
MKEDIDYSAYGMDEDVAIGEPQFIFPPESASWSGPLYYVRGHRRNTIITAIVLFAIAGLVYIFDSNLLTTVVIALLGVLILVTSHKKAPIVEFEVSSVGVSVDDKAYLINDLESFWIDYVPELDVYELSLQLKQWHKSYVKIPLQAQDPVQIRDILLEFVPEEEHHVTLEEKLRHKIGI